MNEIAELAKKIQGYGGRVNDPDEPKVLGDDGDFTPAAYRWIAEQPALADLSGDEVRYPRNKAIIREFMRARHCCKFRCPKDRGDANWEKHCPVPPKMASLTVYIQKQKTRAGLRLVGIHYQDNACRAVGLRFLGDA